MSKVLNLSLKKKLILSLSIVVLLFGLVIAVLLNSQFKLGAIQDEGASRFKDSGRISEIILEVSNVYTVSADAIVNMDLNETKKDILELKNKKDKGIEDVNKIADTDAEKKIVFEFNKNYDDYLKVVEFELLPLLEKTKGVSDEVRKLDGKLDEIRNKTLSSLQLLSKSIKAESYKSDEVFDKTFKSGVQISAAISIAAILLSVLLILFISSSLTSQLRKVANSLNVSSNQVASAATQIASASDELSQATTEQAASLQETSASVEEINSMINANTENAKQASRASEDSLLNAEKGKAVVNNMIKAIVDIDSSNNSIMNQINETNAEIENIIKIIHEIGNKTKVINEIVFQTKLLSFNASVEAARAGEQGLGFTVVAEEVGNLASMSGAAALEITNILEGSIKKVSNIVSESKEKIGKLVLNGREKVEIGTRVAHECGDVLNEIVLSVASVSKMASEISSASEEQALGVREISKAIAQLEQVTQQNTSNSQESANAAGVLSNEAEALNTLVHSLVQTIEGEQIEDKQFSENKYRIA